eukprot:6490352-Amphidinium_carterae.1
MAADSSGDLMVVADLIAAPAPEAHRPVRLPPWQLPRACPEGCPWRGESHRLMLYKAQHRIAIKQTMALKKQLACAAIPTGATLEAAYNAAYHVLLQFE